MVIRWQEPSEKVWQTDRHVDGRADGQADGQKEVFLELLGRS